MLFKSKKINLILLSVIIASTFFAVFFLFQTSPALAQIDIENDQNVSQINIPRAELIQSIIRIINWALGLLGLIAVILCIYAGFLWMNAGGDPSRVDKAKKILINAGIGLAIILLSFAITSYVFNFLGDKIQNAKDPNGGGPGGGGGGQIGSQSDKIFKIDSIVTSCEDQKNYNQNVFLCSAIVINFNHFLDKSTFQEALNSQNLKLEKCTNENCSQTENFSSQSLKWEAERKSITFSHHTLFDSFSTYRLSIPTSLKDTSDNLLDETNACGTGLDRIPSCSPAGSKYYWRFTTNDSVDDDSPEIVSTYPILSDKNNYPNQNVNVRPVVSVKFSESILPNSLNLENIVIKKVVNVNPDDPDNSGTVSTGQLDYEIEINSRGDGFNIYDLILEKFEWYEISVENIQDLCNNSMSEKIIWRFQTNENSPGVKKVYPSDGYEKSCPNTNVYIIFNTSMYNPKNNSCEVLEVNGGFVTSGTFLPNSEKQLLVSDDYPDENENPNNYCKKYKFLPVSKSLNAGTTYNSEVKTNLLISNQENLEKKWSFTVLPFGNCENEEDTENEKLKVIQSNQCDDDLENIILPSPNPYNNSSSVCLNSLISARFNKKIIPQSLEIKINKCDGPTINPCVDESKMTEVNGAVQILDYDLESSFFQFIPNENFSAGKTYQAEILKATSQDQNILENKFVWNFETHNSLDSGICKIKTTKVSPNPFWSNQLDVEQNFNAIALAKNCAEINSEKLNWDWSIEKENIASLTNLENKNQILLTTKDYGTTKIKAELPDGKNSKARIIIQDQSQPKRCQRDSDCESSEDSCEEKICVPDPEKIIPELKILSANPNQDESLTCTNSIANIIFDQTINSSTARASTLTNISLWKESTENISQNSNSNLIKKLFAKIKNLISKVNAQDNWQQVETNLRFETLKNENCQNENGCTKVKIIPKEVLNKGENYRILVKAGSTGVKSSLGGTILNNFERLFSVSNSAEICQISKIEISPAKYNFTKFGQEEIFNLDFLSKTNDEITKVPNVYDWSLEWGKVDTNNISTIKNSTENSAVIKAENINGQATLFAKAKILTDILNQTEDDLFFGYSQITNQLCINPWPSNGQPIEREDTFGSISLFYCRDRGETGGICESGENIGNLCDENSNCGTGGVCKLDTDNLPELDVVFSPNPNSEDACIANQTSDCEARNFLLLRKDRENREDNKDGGDAIGIKFNTNKFQLSPKLWYKNYFEKETTNAEEIFVDGYQAIKENNTIYVSAAQINTNLYTNMYIFGYDDTASDDTIEIFNQLIQNLKFNVNIPENDLRICEDDSNTYCEKDLDCETGKCNTKKLKIIRDTKRITDIGDLQKYLSDYFEENGNYPKLESGSYVQSQSTSKWPSWQNVLATDLNTTLSNDPLNIFGICPNQYDQISCWNELEDPKFLCPENSYIYQYFSKNNGTSYEIYATMEYEDNSWKNYSGSCENYQVTK